MDVKTRWDSLVVMLGHFGQRREILPSDLPFQFSYPDEFPSQAEVALIEEFATSLGTIKKTVNDLGRRDCDLIKADKLLSLMLKKLRDSQGEIGHQAGHLLGLFYQAVKN